MLPTLLWYDKSNSCLVYVEVKNQSSVKFTLEMKRLMSHIFWRVDGKYSTCKKSLEMFKGSNIVWDFTSLVLCAPHMMCNAPLCYIT